VNNCSPWPRGGISLLCLARILRAKKVETMHEDANDFFLPDTSVVVHEAVLFDRVA
jgi:hypothetical protein